MEEQQPREDAKQLLRVAYERRAADGLERMQVDLTAAAEQRGLPPDSPRLASLVDYMEVAQWIVSEPRTRSAVGGPIHSVTMRGLDVLREI